MRVVALASGVKQMHGRDVAFAPRHRRNAAHAAYRDRAQRNSLLGKPRQHDIECDAMTAHDHQIRQPRLRADQCHVGGGTRIECGRKRVDRQKAIRLRESRNRSRALAGRKRSQAVIARGQSDEHEFLAAEFGRNANRNARIHALRSFLRQAGAGANQRRNECMEGKDRGGGKPGNTAIGLPNCLLVASSTARHSGFPGLRATPCTSTRAMRDTIRYERSPAPFDVPPDRSTMSDVASARRSAASSATSLSRNAPNVTGSPPASATAAAMIAVFES